MDDIIEPDASEIQNSEQLPGTERTGNVPVTLSQNTVEKQTADDVDAFEENLIDDFSDEDDIFFDDDLSFL